MVRSDLINLFTRDLNKLRTEISSYGIEADLWKIKGNIANSAGNLCLHLVGNLNTYIGKELGGTAYVRDRDAEFSRKNVPQQQLLEMIDNTILVVQKSLLSITDESLGEMYPVLVMKEHTTTGFFLVHLYGHLGYHLGQINYHRRLC